MTIVELNHGTLDVKLLVCNKALRLAVISVAEDLGVETSVVFSNQATMGQFLYAYAYFCYQIYCKKNRVVREFDQFDFEEMILEQEVKEGESNLSEVLEVLSDSLVTNVKKGIEKAQEESKKKVIATIG